MDERAIRQMLLTRHYLQLAADQVRQDNSTCRFTAINLYHEAFETTLITCADHLNSQIPSKATIETYLDRIDDKLRPHALPFRSRMMQFNHARVAAKHHANLPDAEFFEMIKWVVPDFIKQAVKLTFDVELEEVSLLELIDDADVVGYLEEAIAHLSRGAHHECLVAARKALYLQFEKSYDIAPFAGVEKAAHGSAIGLLAMCNAPHYAKNKSYIDKSVRRPTDYIVLDHGKIDATLLNDGIDPATFWNIWRLTPKVYKFQTGNWAADYVYDIADDPNAQDHCRYVIDNLIAISLQRQNVRRRIMSRDLSARFIHVRADAPVLRKAQRGSEVEGHLPPGVRRVNVESRVTSLDGEDTFIQISYLRKDGPFLFGYINVEETVGEPQPGFVADDLDPDKFVRGNPDDDVI